MSLNPRLHNWIDRHPVRYEVVQHRDTATTSQAANVTHVAGCHVAKVVVFRDRFGSHLMAVLPASLQFDWNRVECLMGGPGVRLEDEKDLARLFPDCEVGAMPPIGQLYGLPMFIDRCLLEDQNEIWFQAGNHHELVRMTVADFQRLAGPFVCVPCLHREQMAAAS